MIANPHHPTKPVKTFASPADETYYNYRFVTAHRNCWIWHVISDRDRRPPEDVRYIVQCPDGWLIYTRSLTEAKVRAGLWDNGMNPCTMPEVYR